MYALSENGKSLIQAGSLFITETKDKENNSDKVIGYRVMAKGGTSPKPITVKSFTGDDALEKAKAYIFDVARHHEAEY